MPLFSLQRHIIFPFYRFKVDKDAARVGVIIFGEDVNKGVNQMIELANIDNPGVLQVDITLLDITPTGGQNIHAAINEMIDMFNRNNDRPGIPKLAFLIAGDGEPNVPVGDFGRIEQAG